MSDDVKTTTAPEPARLTRRARVTFADKKLAPTLHGKHLSRAEGDYEEATGILWNVRDGKGVDAAAAKDYPIGVHLPTGNLIQFIPEGVEQAKKTPQQIVDELEGVEDPADRGGVNPDEGETFNPPGRPPSRQRVAPTEPVTEAAKRAAAKKAAEQAAKAPLK